MNHSLEIKRRSNTVRFKSIINEAFSCFIGFDPFISPPPSTVFDHLIKLRERF